MKNRRKILLKKNKFVKSVITKSKAISVLKIQSSRPTVTKLVKGQLHWTLTSQMKKLKKTIPKT